MEITGLTPTKLREALALYKVKYGYTKNKDIDLDKLDELIKETKDGSKTTTRKSAKSSR